MRPLNIERILGSRHMIEILVFLHNFQPRSKTEIYQMISTSPHMADKLNFLEEAGLITTFSVEGSRKVLHRLTENGETLAAGLQHLEESSGGNMDEYRADTMMDLLRYSGKTKQRV